MDELAFLMDWDLDAINELAPTTNNPYFSHLFSEQDDELLFGSFPEFSKTKNALIDEFEELCKPCYPLSSQTIVTTSSLTTIVPKEPHHEVKEIKASKKVASQDLYVPAVPKCKKSKKKNKNIVKKVTAVDGTLCDAWAWRKYGQKPIKGSPYPRSYYRCSSSKGCLARKQVEKNHLDPKVYLVTYTAEHNHPQPTRRNSLAGSTRKNNNLLVEHSSSTLTRAQKTCSINSLVVTHSPNTTLVKIEDEVSMQEQSNGILEDMEDHHLLEWLDGAQLCDDGWIPSKELEEFIGLDNKYQ
jgi:WRKY transcription factor 22